MKTRLIKSFRTGIHVETVIKRSESERATRPSSISPHLSVLMHTLKFRVAFTVSRGVEMRWALRMWAAYQFFLITHMTSAMSQHSDAGLFLYFDGSRGFRCCIFSIGTPESVLPSPLSPSVSLSLPPLGTFHSAATCFLPILHFFCYFCTWWHPFFRWWFPETISLEFVSFILFGSCQ